jgi:hypothetical protein
MISAMRHWSRPARFATLLIVVAAIILEVVAYLTYRDTVDGQAAIVNIAIVIYATVAVAVVRALDWAAHWFVRRN